MIRSSAATHSEKESAITTEATTQTFSVTGMTCGHCVSVVTAELEALDGVSDVAVDLVAGGTSTVTVTSAIQLDQASVSSALDGAGDYQLGS
jgi:copper chaperone